MLFFRGLVVSLAVASCRAAVGSGAASGGSNTVPYSYSLTTFDPSGRLQQLEFALRAVERAPGAAAVITGDGVVVATWSTGSAPSLHVCRVTESIAMTYAGLEADFRALAAKCMTMAVDHRRDYGTDITVSGLADDLSGLVQEHTQVAGLRPFGATVLLAGRDEYGVDIVKIDPSGWMSPWRATAVGKNAPELEDALADALPTLRTVEDAVAFFKDKSPVMTAALFRDVDSEDGRDDETPAKPRRRFHTSLAVVRRSEGSKALLFSSIDDFEAANSH
ncbi:hypothetical protein CTAYLR_005987 [Chrysophaeum taylorii]|uniref:Proteasome alpha-type subunits domain-containing protein n=1 Tax=Chrysophaeum taylorii TaxID=2483200 RepID=A0AAD7U5L8_9STRA|nr:hypothetical protein CTAYLR_005987 [Chrysophaeum taylorii]